MSIRSGLLCVYWLDHCATNAIKEVLRGRHQTSRKLLSTAAVEMHGRNRSINRRQPFTGLVHTKSEANAPVDWLHLRKEE